LQYPPLSLIIPCYNESSRVAQMMEGIKEFLGVWHGDFEFIIVDDGSTDDTVASIKQFDLYKNLFAEHKIKIVQQKNIGKGGALQNGMMAATKSFAVTLDADMATHPAEVIRWMRLSATTFDGKSICIADRTLTESQLILISNRRDSGKLFNTIVRFITKLPFADTQCGFKLYPTTIGQQLFTNLITNGWAHDVEILCKAVAQQIPITCMPIKWNEQAASKINVWKDGLTMLWEVVKIKWKLL
jgi:dolichyl-phosphate beta-glucosyltransferase